VGNVGKIVQKVRETVVEMGDEHSELGTPVANVVYAEHLNYELSV
uniref:Uncharacterized protein n=1 Tax=Caenorhabditis japonica TaxID=281687 RepID=A0A8R1EPP6_CAEJA